MTAGVKVGEYRPEDLDEEVDIRVRFPAEQRRLDQFDDLTVNTRFGQAPLSSFVEVVPAIYLLLSEGFLEKELLLLQLNIKKAL